MTDYSPKSIARREVEKKKYFEVEPPEQYKTGRRRNLYPKQCHEKSWEYMFDKSDEDKVLLVNGIIEPIREFFIVHTWVEVADNIVFESTLQRFYKLDEYYRINNVRYTSKFTFDEFIKEDVKYDSYGAYDEKLRMYDGNSIKLKEISKGKI